MTARGGSSSRLFSFGAPIALSMIDPDGFLGPGDAGAMPSGMGTFNHSGAVGFGFWEENLPKWIQLKDPALAVIDFLKCGNIFYPIPGAPLPVPKEMMLWGIPWIFPMGLIWKFSFYFGDRGGCLFMGTPALEGGEADYSRRGR